MGAEAKIDLENVRLLHNGCLIALIVLLLHLERDTDQSEATARVSVGD